MDTKVVRESLDDNEVIFTPHIFETQYGNIDYFYIINKEYPNGLVILNGSIVFKEYRGTGKFKLMLKQLLSYFPPETLLQAASITKKLASMFKRIGFYEVDKIEYWGSPANCTLLQGTLTQEMIDLL